MQLLDQKPGSWLQCILMSFKTRDLAAPAQKWNPFKLVSGVWYTTTLAKIERLPCKLSHGAGSPLLDYTTIQILSCRLQGNCSNQTSDQTAMFVIIRMDMPLLKTVQCSYWEPLKFTACFWSFRKLLRKRFLNKLGSKGSVSVHPAQGAPPYLPGRSHSPVCTHRPT